MNPPDWFVRNIERSPMRGSTDVSGAQIETLVWGEVGAPGLLFVHGNGAHADWWTPLAPFFSDDQHVVAFSFSGMGRSDRRDAYSVEVFSQEVVAVADATGLFGNTQKPWVVAHSMGAIIAARAMVTAGHRFAGLVIVDSGAIPAGAWTQLSSRASPNAGFDSFDEGLARFRLSPVQPGVAPWLLDFIAQRSLRQGDDDRWYWCFDPLINDDLGIRHHPVPGYEGYIQGAKCPLTFIWGDDSILMTQAVRTHTRQVAPAGTRFVEMPEAHHHLMLDQPVAFVTALRAILA